MIFWSNSLYSKSQICLGDGTGRHARLKIWWLHGRAGSSPALGNLDMDLDLVSDFFSFFEYFLGKKIFCKVFLPLRKKIICNQNGKKYISL